MERFTIRRGGPARLLWPLVRGPQHVEVTDDEVRIRLGLAGHAELPLLRIARIGHMTWPWWGGLGVRIATKMVGFVTRPGRCVLIEMEAPVRVSTPFGWRTPRIAVSVDDPDGLAAAIAHARARAVVAQSANETADG